MTSRVELQNKEISGHHSQGAWCEDELIGGKPSDVK
jgi:hypothetical protein